MHNKILKQALLLAKYASAKDEVLYLLNDLNRAEQRRVRLHRELTEMVGEEELFDILEEEPTSVENPT